MNVRFHRADRLVQYLRDFGMRLDHGAPEVLSSVLVDPNLHTDMRMRIHQEILQILTEASANASGRPSGVLRS